MFENQFFISKKYFDISEKTMETMETFKLKFVSNVSLS
jgi:hypothetical protein